MYECVCGVSCYYFFLFKQKTAYEMRISDWSSDVCSSDLDVRKGRVRDRHRLRQFRRRVHVALLEHRGVEDHLREVPGLQRHALRRSGGAACQHLDADPFGIAEEIPDAALGDDPRGVCPVAGNFNPPCARSLDPTAHPPHQTTPP